MSMKRSAVRLRRKSIFVQSVPISSLYTLSRSANAAGETVITRIPITPLSYERNSDPLSLGPREARSNFTYAEVYSVPTPQKPAWRQMQAQAAQTRGMAAADATITKTQKDASTADD